MATGGVDVFFLFIFFLFICYCFVFLIFYRFNCRPIVWISLWFKFEPYLGSCVHVFLWSAGTFPLIEAV